jgi:hypothetical protein
MEINFLSISDIDLYSKISYIETKHRFEESNFLKSEALIHWKVEIDRPERYECATPTCYRLKCHG